MLISISHGSALPLWPLLSLALLAVATTAQAAPPNPADASLPSPLQYTSAISTYQAYADTQVQPWRESNDNVGRIGGWRTYAKEATATSKTAPEAPQAPMADPHAGHHSGAKP